MQIAKDLSHIYNQAEYYSASDTCSLQESQKGAKVKGAKIHLVGAHFYWWNESIWNASENAYRNYTDDLLFRKKCDGFVICHYNDRKYLIWVELKSGFNDVFKKAIFQISACYMKAKSIANNFKSFNGKEFEELGLIISLPEEDEPTDVEDNTIVADRRTSLIRQNDGALDKCRKRYRATGKLLLRGSDYGTDILNLKEEIVLHELPVCHVPVDPGVPDIDLAQVIRQTLNHEP